MSISPTFYTFGFVIFWRQNIGKKAARKMLVKLTTVVNFINILQVAFAQIFFCQTVIKEKLCKAPMYQKGASKMLMKLTPIKLFSSFSNLRC